MKNGTEAANTVYLIVLVTNGDGLWPYINFKYNPDDATAFQSKSMKPLPIGI